MATEIERKFLVKNDGWRRHVVGEARLWQGYLAAEGQTEVRVRIKNGGGATLTVKAGSGLARAEYEYDIPQADAEAMLNLVSGVVLEKTRYQVATGERTWEVDVYTGALRPLIVAEIELGAEDEDLGPLPDWLGDEVTGDKRYSNAVLALRGAPDGDA